MEQFIMSEHTALRISDSEQGQTVLVLLHGYLESLEIWEDFVKLLSPLYRIVTIDIPGHGISEVKSEIHTMEFVADVLRGVLDNKQIARCFVAGHSMGGYVAEAFAAKYPERLEGLILFHSSPNADNDSKKEDRRREIEMIRHDKKELIAQLFAPKGFAPHNRDRMINRIEQLQELIALTDDEGIIALLKGMSERDDMNDMMHRLSAPQLFIFGKYDEFIPVERAEALIQSHPQAEIAWLENSGHMGFLEEPDASAEIIRSFINRHGGVENVQQS